MTENNESNDVVDLTSARYRVRQRETIKEKFADAEHPGYMAEFSPEEAETAGAFREDALSETDALDGALPDPDSEK